MAGPKEAIVPSVNDLYYGKGILILFAFEMSRLKIHHRKHISSISVFINTHCPNMHYRKHLKCPPIFVTESLSHNARLPRGVLNPSYALTCPCSAPATGTSGSQWAHPLHTITRLHQSELCPSVIPTMEIAASFLV